MMHFFTPTVPPPRTKHSLMHNSTRGMSPGQMGLQVRFRENIRFGPFSWVAHDFRHSGQFFLQHPGCAHTRCRTHLVRFHYFLDRRVQALGVFSLLRCLWNRELLPKRKPEWYISSLLRSLLHVPSWFNT
jgi:hypothetical protein